MRGILAIFLCFWFSCGSSQALVMMDGLTSEMRNFELFMYDYKMGNGAYPKTWEELESFSEHVDWNREPHKLRQRISILDKEVVWKHPSLGGRIIAITRDSFRPQDFRRSRWTGRINPFLLKPSYTAFIERDGSLHFQRLPPELVATIFKEAGSELPKPSGLGPYPHEIRARRKQIREFVFYTICTAVISVWIARMILRRRKGR